MPETDTRTDKKFFEDVPPPDQGFFLKGSASYDWGMKNRLSRIFRPDSGHTVMLAIDHGYFQGPTTGLERGDVTILPARTVCGRVDVHAGHPSLDDPGVAPRWGRHPCQWRPEHPEGAVERAHGRRPRGRRAHERARGRGPGLHRRRVRDAVCPEPDHARGRRLPRRHPGSRRHRGRHRARPRRTLPRARHPHLRRARSPDRQDLLLRWVSSTSPQVARFQSSWPVGRSSPSWTR